MTTPPAFLPLTGLYEPSAILQLPDGRFLAVEDEKAHPFSLVEIALDGRVASRPLAPGWLDFDTDFWRLDDLEGLACDRHGRVHAITSHSRDGEGDEKKTRAKLVRFRIEADRIVDRQVASGLKPVLAAVHPALRAAAEVRDVKGAGGLNVEALEFAGDGLLVGLRSPLLDGRAVLVRLGEPEALFSGGDPHAGLVTLDLAGHGLRGLAWVPALAGFLALAGPVAREDVQFRLWFWSGRPEDPARRVEVAGLAGYEHAEGICPAVIAGQARIVVVSDDGSRKDDRPARFLLLDPARLRIAD